MEIQVDGETHAVSSALGGDWRSLVLEQPKPSDREYQVDGSDTTATDDRNALFIAGLLNTPLYKLDAFLRDESSYSRWEWLSIVDLATGQAVAPDGVLPADFRVDVDLRRPEAVARLWLVNAAGDRKEGLELDRDMRNARWVVDHGQGAEALPSWFFPEQPAPFAAELLQLLGRTLVAAYALVLAALGLGWLLAFARRPWVAFSVEAHQAHGTRPVPPTMASRARSLGRAHPDLALAAWLVLAAVVTMSSITSCRTSSTRCRTRFRRVCSPRPALAARAVLPEAFKGPFEVVWQGQLFSQYPPGARPLRAGQAGHLEWLVGPLLAWC